jgi:thiamine pyrophosphokinase
MTVSGQSGTIVWSEGPVTLVGGGRLGADDLRLAVAHGPQVVAVDGGAGAVLAAGITPLAVIGDMDSLPGAAAAAFADRLHLIPEQETTDFDKALRSTFAPMLLAVGFSGGRFDHELAVLNALLRYARRPCVVIGPESLTFHCPPRLVIAPPEGSVFSLFPLLPVGVVSEGLRWPTEGLDFRPEGMIGTSNLVTGPVRLEAGGPGMLVILPRTTLGLTVAALSEAPRWGG